jgi:hypothetical protein
LVEVEEIANTSAHLVEVTAGQLDPRGVRETASFQRVEAGAPDQMLMVVAAVSSSVA